MAAIPLFFLNRNVTRELVNLKFSKRAKCLALYGLTNCHNDYFRHEDFLEYVSCQNVSQLIPFTTGEKFLNI